MPIVSVQQAKNCLSRLLAQVEAGEDVIIARRGEPVARLVPFNPPGQRKFGAMRDRIVIDESFHEPLPEDELKAWEGS